MKNLLLIVMITAICMSCKNSKSANKSGDSSDSTFVYNDRFIKIDSSTKAEFEKYPEFDFKKSIDNSGIIKSKKDTLKFVIDSLKNVVFKDTLTDGDSDGYTKYEHIGNILDYYIVQAHYYESSGFFLVNKKNGIKYEMISEPYLSPNHKYLLANSASLEYAVMPTGLQVWIVKNDKLIKKSDLDLAPKGFEIDEMRWITDDKLAVKIGFGTGKNAYGILTIK